MRKGFTLIELLAIVAIIGIMVTAGVTSIRAGQAGARVKAATRDIFASIRHARSLALVSQQPSIVTYSTVMVDDEPCAKLDVVTARIFSATAAKEAWTLAGEKVWVGDDPPEGDGGAAAGAEGAGGNGGGETIEDILFAPIAEDVVRGVCIRVQKEGDIFEEIEETRAKPKVSVFSNVDYLIGRYNDAKAEAKRKADEAAAAAGEAEEAEESAGGKSAAAAGESGEQAPVQIVWEVNGRTEPHRVWVYSQGTDYNDGMCIAIDRFGAAKVLEEDEK